MLTDVGHNVNDRPLLKKAFLVLWPYLAFLNSELMVIRWGHGHICQVKGVKRIFFKLLVNIEHAIVLRRQRTVQRWGKDCRCQLANRQTKAQFLPGEKTNISTQTVTAQQYWNYKHLNSSYRNIQGKASLFQSLNPRLRSCSLHQPPTLSWPPLPPHFIKCILGLLLALPKLRPPSVELTANLTGWTNFQKINK